MSQVPQPVNPPDQPTGSGLLSTVMNEIAQRADQPPETPPPATPEQPQTPNEQATVPSFRLREETEKRTRAEQELAELRRWKEDQETAQLSEIERATRAREEAEQRAQTAERRALELERTGLIREAARAAGFADPSDAVAFLSGQLDGIDSEAAAKQAVAKLAEDKKHLLAAERPSTPTPIGGLTPSTPSGEIPVGPDGKPDVKAGIGRDLLASLIGRQ